MFKICPDWCSSGDWVLAWEPKGHWFNSQSGHMPGMQARSSVGDIQKATHIDVSLPLFLPLLPLSKNKTKSF